MYSKKFKIALISTLVVLGVSVAFLNSYAKTEDLKVQVKEKEEKNKAEKNEFNKKEKNLLEEKNVLEKTLEQKNSEKDNLNNEKTELQKQIDDLNKEKEDLTSQLVAKAALKKEEESKVAPVVAVASANEEAVADTSTPASTVAYSGGTSVGTFNVTHYSAFDGSQSGVTANGTDVRGGQTRTADGHRIIAVSTNVIPLNSLVQVTLANGESFTARACDTGGAIVGNKIDLLVGSASEAMALGTTTATISIL